MLSVLKNTPDFVMIEPEGLAFSKIKPLVPENGAVSLDDITVSVEETAHGCAVFLTAQETPVSFVRLRFCVPFPIGTRFLGDAWERSYGDLSWQGMNASRIMPWYCLAHHEGQTAGYGEWGSVLDAEITLAKAAGLGFREIFDAATAQETFEVYQGTDRTQGEGYNGWFGDDIGNLASYTLAQGTDGWKNLAIVAGEGEGADRTVVTASLGDYTGDDRRELWVDAKDLTRRCQVAVSDGSGGYTYTEKTYSESEYKALLQARGLEKLAQCLPALEVDASLGQGTLVYGRDYGLGDLVPLKLTGCGLRMTARVSAVRTVYESTGRTVRAVLSDFAITSNFSAAKEAIG